MAAGAYPPPRADPTLAMVLPAKTDFEIAHPLYCPEVRIGQNDQHPNADDWGKIRSKERNRPNKKTTHLSCFFVFRAIT